MSSIKTDTHFYDGKLGDVKQELMADITSVRGFLSEYASAFEKLRQWVAEHPQTNSAVIHCLDSIVNTFDGVSVKKNANYDPTNDMHAEDLLYLLYERISEEKDGEDTDYLDILVSQLYDMRTGLCAQGRVTRLFQVLVMLR